MDNSGLNFTIANAASISDKKNFADIHNMAFIMPTAWTPAGLTLQGSDLAAPVDATANNWWTICDVFGELVLPAAANRVLIIPTNVLLPSLRWWRVLSGTTGAPVAQGAERIIAVKARRY